MEKSHKEISIERMKNVLKGQLMYITESTTLDPKEKLEEADVIFDLVKFLNDYDENCKVLNQYCQEKHRREKFKQEEPER